METANTKGSIWRIWDLHVHSPQTYGGDFSTFIRNASESKASVIGVNDYCSVKGYEEIMRLGGIPSKTVFPIVELRMHNVLVTRKNPNGVKINFHIIFDNEPAVFPKIATWIASLKCYDERGNPTLLGTVTDLMKISFDYDNVIEKLKEFKIYGSHALVWLPYDEYGGIDEINPTSDPYFKAALTNTAHIMGSSSKEQIKFFKWEDEKFSLKQYMQWFDKPKPCIKGSDAHEIDYPFGCLRNQQSQPIDKFCWINAETTFAGLQQIVTEPGRVFIGDEPDLLKRVRANRTKFIRSLEVKKSAGATIDDVWFNNFNIDLNSGLVAIIGNKGGGKSAITDIISLCGNTYQDPQNFSFLTTSKFRKAKPFNLSDRFEANLCWEDDTIASKKLSANPDKTLPERVKYIPQNFLERLCANVESDDFEKELKQIIYSHTPGDKRLGKSSLDELISYKSSIVNDEIGQVQASISKINTEIVILENKATESHKRVIESQLTLKQGELFTHESIKPIQPPAEQANDESKALVEKLTTLRAQITALEDEISELNKKKSAYSIRKEELNRAIQSYKNIDEQLKKYLDPSNEFVQILTRNNINHTDVFKYTVDVSPLTTAVETILHQIADIDKVLDTTNIESKTNQLKKLNDQLQKDQEELDKPAKAQQKYLDELKNWEAKKKEIEGSLETEGTLKFFEFQLSYLNNSLLPELSTKYEDRKKLLISLYTKKLSLLDIRKELFQPVTKFIAEFKELKEKYDVKIDVALEIRAFIDTFFTYINQGRVGTFSGKEEGYKRMQDTIERTHFDTAEGFLQFTEELIENLKFDKRTPANTPVDINTQLRKDVGLSALYDFICCANYLQPIYNLKLGTKTLTELSPGERGALLLIFYLILDNDDIPLIIDQPEENLDNESVYHILVHFIKKVKEKRQIIIVTHNPNLAVVCDADQIIHMQIEKENKNTVKYISGAIEDLSINNSIVNILEGTLPAFNNRDSKYLKERIKNMSALVAMAKEPAQTTEGSAEIDFTLN